ncbi:MAG TPA: AMP-binding protein, partial [Micromonosporaceae bacterium]|nr:AMP-binding protein [Micromonosporaceae bacterium]
RWALDRLVAAARETQREFGTIGADGDPLLGGPALDDETRRELHLRRFRQQATRAARETAYYGRLFAHLSLDPARLRYDDIQHLPPTPKAALRADPDAFVRRTARPQLRCLTTGTTGSPTGVYFSAAELHAMVALSALGFLLHRQIEPTDVVHLGTSAGATLGNLGLAGACARIGALADPAGLVEPARTLALLAEPRRLAGKKPRASILSTYPSYLGQLVECGLRLGYRPADFGLERIFLGGELATAGLLRRCRALFGAVECVESYAMTETLPFGGARCEGGHLHFEASHGLLEVRDPETGAPARAGEAGTLVATPLPPYRETTLLLRYDTEDVVRPLAGPLGCGLRTLTATTNLLGKLPLAVRHADGWTFPRDVAEALEAVEAVPLPARYGFRAVPGGVAVEVVARHDGAAARRAIAAALEGRGVPLRALRVVAEPNELQRPVPLRCDLRETGFGTPARAAAPADGPSAGTPRPPVAAR